MVQDNTWFESSDGTKLYVRRWMPGTAPLAVVHILHGMAEYAQRYERLAVKLGGAGIETWAADQRGHGKTADTGVNEQGKGGLLGHCADRDTFERITADLHAVNREIRKTRPGVPLVLLGHSWGSFIAQNYIESSYCSEGRDTTERAIDGCILSGTRGPAGFKIKAGLPFMTLLAALHGSRHGSILARAAADGPYNRAFRPNRTPFDWLSRDEAEVDAYVADPLCGFLCSAGFYRDLAKGLNEIHRSDAMARIRKSLPIYIVCGNADPVGDMGSSPMELVNVYRSLGIQDLEFVLYPGARHEPLNETNREEVMDNLLAWICRRFRQVKE